MLGYCRLTSLTWRKESNNDTQADYLHFYSNYRSGPDVERAQEAGAGLSGCRAQRKPNPTGNTSLVIKTR